MTGGEDDLDAFFDEVEEAEHQVEESTAEGESISVRNSNERKEEDAAPRPQDKNKNKNDDDDNDAAKPTAPKRPRLVETEEDSQPKPKTRSTAVVVAASAPSVVVAAASPAILAPTAAATTSSLLFSSAVGPSAPPHYDASKGLASLHSTTNFLPPPPPPPPPPAAAALAQHSQDGAGHGEKNATKLAVTKRTAAGKTWVDESLAEFPADDFRLFVGNLARDIRLEQLSEAFASKYPSFNMARIVYDKASGKSRGYGFVSLGDPKECARAIREMDQVFLGSRPIRVKRSEWKDRDMGAANHQNNKTKGSARQSSSSSQRNHAQRRGDAGHKRKR